MCLQIVYVSAVTSEEHSEQEIFFSQRSLKSNTKHEDILHSLMVCNISI